MKADQLKEYITKIVRTEVRTVIHEEVKKCLTEAFSGQKMSDHKTTDEDIDTSFKSLMESDAGEPPTTKTQKPQNQVVYTKNPIINAVLNETAQTFRGIPQEGSMVGMIGNFQSGGTELINETVAATEIPVSAPVAVKKTAAVFNRDFRSLMKAVDKKVSAKKG